MTELIVDLFAGGGGASHGIYMATGRHPDAAVNHDPVAVAVHARNHPDTAHYCQDVWTVHPAWISRGRPVGLLWASPDCTHHSKAKGAAPTRDERRRDLAMVIADKWVPVLKPRVIILENVEEFQDWGPLRDGKIVEASKGQKFREFLNRLRRHRYAVEYRQLRACDYGAPTMRNRLYLIARCDGRPIVWPEPTHGAPNSPEVRSGQRLPWRTAAECIDFSLPCPSIFATSEEIKALYGLRAVRPLAESTLRRIFRGLKKYVIDNPEPFIVKNYTGVVGQSTDAPLGTVTTIDHHALIEPYLASYYGDKGGDGFRGRGVEEPLPTQITENRFSLQTPYMVKCNHTAQGYDELRGQDLETPLSTVTAKRGFALVAPYIQHVQHGGTKNDNRTGCMSADDPMRTITALPKGGGTNIGQPQDVPLQTLTAGGTHFAEVRAFLQKYYGEGGQDQDIARPLDTITTKARFGVVTVHGEDYTIVDIGMRMLQPKELLLANGFPATYVIGEGVDGKPTTKEQQVRLIGNSVCPPVAAALVSANYAESRAITSKAAAC